MHFQTAFKRRLQIEKPHATARSPRHQALWYKTIEAVFCGKGVDRGGEADPEEDPGYECP